MHVKKLLIITPNVELKLNAPRRFWLFVFFHEVQNVTIIYCNDKMVEINYFQFPLIMFYNFNTLYSFQAQIKIFK